MNKLNCSINGFWLGIGYAKQSYHISPYPRGRMSRWRTLTRLCRSMGWLSYPAYKEVMSGV